MSELGDEYFRFAVLPGGCSGFQYSLEQMKESDVEEDDTVVTVNKINFVIDSFSYHYLDGTLIHYESSMMGSGFTFQNPNADGGCGCGSSFTV